MDWDKLAVKDHGDHSLKSEGVGVGEPLEKIMSSKMPGGPAEPVSARLMVSH